MESSSGFEDAATKSFVSMAALYIELLVMSMKNCATANSNFKHGDFRAAIEADIEVLQIADAGIDIKRPGLRVKKSQVIFIHVKRQADRAVKGNAHLAAVRMAGKHQIKFPAAEVFDPRRIVHEQDV